MTRVKQLALLQPKRLAAGLCLAWALLLVAPLRATPAAADVVINDCTTQDQLAAALNGPSGLIAFSCGPSPVTVVLTQDGGFNAVPASTFTIDGGNLVTLSGGNNNRVFDVAATAALTLSNIILSNGYAAAGPGLPSQGGAILVNDGGVLVLNNVTVRDSQSAYAGGAIENAYGTATLVDSLIENNQSDYGGGIDSNGTLTLVNTTVRGNHALTDTGGGLDISGTVFINTSQIVSNTANNSYGGGIYSLGTLTLTNSSLSGNLAKFGGGIYSLGTLTLTNSSLSGNTAKFGGGGIFIVGTATLTDSTLNGNSAGVGGGIGIGPAGMATLTDITLSGNSAYNGGGIFNDTSTATLTNVTLSGNSASVYGGGIYNYYGNADLINVTLSGNSANTGGGVRNEGTLGLWNVTLSGNSATTGGALYIYPGHTTWLTNTVIAYSPMGGNCKGDPIAASKYNISSDNTCALAGPGDHNNLDPLLTALGNYGGPTRVHMLKLGSPAIDGVVGSDAPGTDQRGLPRPQGHGFDIGAVERQPTDSDLAPWSYLPLIVR